MACSTDRRRDLPPPDYDQPSVEFKEEGPAGSVFADGRAEPSERAARACDDLDLRATAEHVVAAGSRRTPSAGLPSACDSIAECSCEELAEFVVTSDVLRDAITCGEACVKYARCDPEPLENEQLLQLARRAAAQARSLMSTTFGPVVVPCTTSDSSCQASENCKRVGLCDAKGGKCVAASSESCRASEGCRLEGACTARDWFCVIASSEDCRKSEACAREGACDFPGDLPYWPRCQPTKPEHCRQSEVCRAEDRCSLEEVRSSPHNSYARISNRCASAVVLATDEAQRAVHVATRSASVPVFRHALEHGGELSASQRIVRELAYGELGGIEGIASATVLASVSVGDDDTHRYEVPCRRFVELAHELVPPSTFLSNTGRLSFRPWIVEWNGQPVLDYRPRICGELDYFKWRFLSWVGPVLSYHEFGRKSELSDWSHVSVERKSIDLRTGEPAALDTVVETDSVVRAIKNDPWVQARIVEARERVGDEPLKQERQIIAHLQDFENAQTLEALQPAFHGILRLTYRPYGPAWSSGGVPFEGYAFTLYDARKKRVAMRVAIPRSGHSERDHIILGLWVTPRTQFVAAFESAARVGHLMPDFAPPESTFAVPEFWNR